MWRRLSIQLRTLAPTRSVPMPSLAISRQTAPGNPLRSFPAISRHFATESVGNATGHEREELEAELKGENLEEVDYPPDLFGPEMAYVKPFKLFHLALNAVEKKCFLGVDPGTKGIGFSYSDSDLRTAYALAGHPLVELTDEDRDEDDQITSMKKWVCNRTNILEIVDRAIKEKNVGYVVVGCNYPKGNGRIQSPNPLDIDYHLPTQGAAADFIGMYCPNLPFTIFDEYGTTKVNMDHRASIMRGWVIRRRRKIPDSAKLVLDTLSSRSCLNAYLEEANNIFDR